MARRKYSNVLPKLNVPKRRDYSSTDRYLYAMYKMNKKILDERINYSRSDDTTGVGKNEMKEFKGKTNYQVFKHEYMMKKTQMKKHSIYKSDADTIKKTLRSETFMSRDEANRRHAFNIIKNSEYFGMLVKLGLHRSQDFGWQDLKYVGKFGQTQMYEFTGNDGKVYSIEIGGSSNEVSVEEI